MNKKDLTSLENFLAGSNNKNVAIVDVTKEI